MEFKYTRKVGLSFEKAREIVKQKLEEKSFKVLIDLHASAIFKEKLGKDFENYSVISACNPAFSYELLNIDRELGVFLPCSIVVYSLQGETFVSASLPTSLMNISGNSRAIEIAKKVDGIFKEIVDSI